MNTRDTLHSDAAIKAVLQDILTHGSTVVGGKSLSVGAGQKTNEILGHQFSISAPTDRLVFNDSLKFSLPLAIARFIWLIGGNDRLLDIQFYTRAVSKFTDDGLVIPGSSYGRRMRYPRPGLDQLASCIEQLKADPSSRRAAISIFFPEDGERESRDIPCAFGMFFHIRDGELVMTNVMRSNNAYLLLPFNLFEFSLVGETVAAALGLKFGRMVYFTASMHLYEPDWPASRLAVENKKDDAGRLLMPEMPRTDKILEQIAVLVRKEAHLRENAAGLNYVSDVEALCEKASEPEELLPGGEKITLDPYFRQFYYLLVLFVIKGKADLFGAHEKVKERLDKVYVDFIGTSLDIKLSADGTALDGILQSDPLYETVDIADPGVSDLFSALSEAAAASGKKLLPSDVPEILRAHRGELLALAARKATDGRLKFDPQKLSKFLR